MAYGPRADKFATVLTGLKPADGNDEPDIYKALEAADWKPADAELDWRRWAITGK